MKKIIVSCFVFIWMILITLMSGCSGFSGGQSSGKIRIVASLFPQYDFARQIAGDRADISLLLPPGTESHTFEPRPADLAEIYDSQVFIYTGKYMEPWADKVIESVKNDELTVVDASKGIDLLRDEDEESGYDPHIWLDPLLAVRMVDNILDALCTADSANTSYYTENAVRYKEELKRLDQDIVNMVNGSKRKILVFGGRFSYHYFMERYGLQYKAVYASCSAETEPSVKQVLDTVVFIEDNHIPCIYYEELADPKTAKTIAEQANIEPLLFSTAHNVTRDQFDRHITYIEIMGENLKNLQKGLN